MQRIANLQAEAVAGSEPARSRTAGENTLPELACLVRHHEQLDSRLARIAGAVDHAGDPVDLALGEREGHSLGQAEPLERARALNRDQAVLVGDVADIRAPVLPLLQPVEVRLAVGCVDDE